MPEEKREDLNKINEFANVLMGLPVPEVKTKEAYALIDQAHKDILEVARKLLESEL